MIITGNVGWGSARREMLLSVGERERGRGRGIRLGGKKV